MPTVFVYEYCCALGVGRDPTDAGHSLYREGRAMRDAVVEDFGCIPGMTVRTLDDVAPNHEETAFCAAATAADWCLIIAPETDRTLERLTHWSRRCQQASLGCSPDAIRLTADKLATAAVWKQNRIPTPRTWSQAEWPGGPYPVVWKPRDGAGSEATYLVRTPDDERPLAVDVRAENSLVQEYVPGRPASVAFLTSAGMARPLIPSFQCLSSDGRFRYEGGTLPIAADLAARAIDLGRRAIACIPGLLGYVGIDLILGNARDGSRDYAIEINPRLTTSYVGLRRLAGFNLAEAILKLATGAPVGAMPWRPGRVRFYSDGSATHDPDTPWFE